MFHDALPLACVAWLGCLVLSLEIIFVSKPELNGAVAFSSITQEL